jgi:hypothetical protein
MRCNESDLPLQGWRNSPSASTFDHFGSLEQLLAAAVICKHNVAWYNHVTTCKPTRLSVLWQRRHHGGRWWVTVNANQYLPFADNPSTSQATRRPSKCARGFEVDRGRLISTHWRWQRPKYISATVATSAMSHWSTSLESQHISGR